MDLLMRCGGQRGLRKGVRNVNRKALSILNSEAVPLENKDHALETTWSRG